MRAWWAAVIAAGCATGAAPGLPAVRFANAPIVAAVNDRRDVPRPPSRREFLPDLYFFDGTFRRPVTRALELPRPRRARGVNALDEVPDSTWFTNRIGTHDLAPEVIERGPVTNDPETAKPWTVRSTKIGGTTTGFIIKDGHGIKYMLKLEGGGDEPELESGTDVIVDRLLWACGYNVPEDLVVYFRPEELVLAPDASVKDHDGNDLRRLERPELERMLAGARHEPDGRYRALASRWIAGTTLGGHPGEGVRADDPNDRIPHELRRDLRGLYVIDAWLDAVDVTEGQFVDTWTADPADPRRHYVEHYAVDFGKSLGAMGAIGHDWWRGYAYRIDFASILRELAVAGLAPRPWQDRAAPAIRGVSPLFEAETFDPGRWHPDTPGYVPFLAADRFDAFWGAKLVARFTPAQLRAAVRAARLSDPRAVDYITATLVARQRATEAYWFARVNPLDRFAIEGGRLCFDDLAIADGFAPGASTTYALASHDFAGRAIAPAAVSYASSGGRTCATFRFVPPDDEHGYTIVAIATRRPRFGGTTYVYVGRDLATGAARVVGVWRR